MTVSMSDRSDRPLILDIDGTLTRTTGNGIDPQVFDPILNWNGPVILATGMSFPYPVALAHFIGIPKLVVAENGGVVFIDGETSVNGDTEAPKEVMREYEKTEQSVEWGLHHRLNRWRKTEMVFSLKEDKKLLKELSEKHNLTVIDTGYAYHVKQPELSKGDGVISMLNHIDVELSNAVAIGDSVNDVSVFEIVQRSFAVANADYAAKDAASDVLSEPHAEGTISALNRYL